jgi:hypothetical protein
MTRRCGPGLAASLAELERTDPAVRAAAKRYDEVVRQILSSPPLGRPSPCPHCAGNGIRALLRTINTARGAVQRCWQCGGEYRDGVRIWPVPKEAP